MLAVRLISIKCVTWLVDVELLVSDTRAPAMPGTKTVSLGDARNTNSGGDWQPQWEGREHPHLRGNSSTECKHLSAVFKGFFEAYLRPIPPLAVERFDRVQWVDEGTDGVEVHVRRQCRLVERSDGARLGLTQRRIVHLVNEPLEQTQADCRVSRTDELPPHTRVSILVVTVSVTFPMHTSHKYIFITIVILMVFYGYL